MAFQLAEVENTRIGQAPAGSITHRINRYLRSEHSLPAKILNHLSSKRGVEYFQSPWKRFLDLSVGIPASIAVSPLVTGLAIAKKIEDGGSMFFTQQRIGEYGQCFGLVKIRCMAPNSDLGTGNIEVAKGKEAHEDPRNTKLGIFMRKYQLEELPQFFQVVIGQMSLLGLRAAPGYIFEYLHKQWPDKRYGRWKECYLQSKPGLSGVNQIFGSNTKEDEKRFRMDVFYSKHASLGFDVYLLYRTIAKLVY